ncbi:MAG TPA: helix-hairpin-helix domain-containing protein [Devosia sp.]|nr:helix-hairpin-helix domain-containing protein [Devosia sp.]
MAETDLKTIDGIGPAMEKKLADLGIADIAALASRTDAKDIAELLGTRGVDEARVAKWIAAAQAPSQERASEPRQEAALAETEAPTVFAPRELSFHELNVQARKIDREHARLRLNATAAANVAAEVELKGIARLNRPRRVQKNIRPLVR